MKSHLAILTIATLCCASLMCVPCAAYNFVVINELEHSKPLGVECAPHPAVSIGKGRRNTWHFDQPSACTFFSDGRKTKIDDVVSDKKDVFYVALNDGIFKSFKDSPWDGRNADWKPSVRWYNEEDFGKSPCERDPISCER